MILQNPEAERRFNAVKRLQQNLKKTFPGSYWSQVYEKALDLALNEQRAVDANFYYRVVDDAKRTLRRLNKTAPSFTSLYTLGEESDEIGSPFLIDHVTPEQLVIYQQSVALLRSACSKKHKHSVAVFYSMMEGHTVSETAHKLCISESMVKKLRAEIINVARTILLN